MTDISTQRLLVVTAIYDRSERALIAGLARRGLQITLLCHPDAPGQSELAAAGVKIEAIRIKHRFDLSAVRILRRVARRDAIQVVLAPRNSSLSVALLAFQRARIGVVGYRGTRGHLSRFDPASWFSYLSPRVDRIWCVSEAVRSYLLEFNLPEDRLVTIHKGHDPAWYQQEGPAPDLTTFGIPKDAIVIGFAGNMRPVKGADYLIRSAFDLSPSLPIHYLLVGQVRDKRLNDIAADERIRHRIHFAGFREDAPRLMGACDVFVMPSVDREGLPRAVIEAMAQSVPAIVTRVGGMPELVEDRVSGLVVPPRDPAALATAIVSLAMNGTRRAHYGAAARARIESHFSITRTVERIHALLDDAAAARAR